MTTQTQTVADERALRLVHELTRISMTLAADLVNCATYSFQGQDYMDRNSVVERVMRWRAEWDSTSAERESLTAAARAALAQPAAATGHGLEYRTCCDHPDCTTCAGHGGFYRMTGQAGATVAAEPVGYLDTVSRTFYPSKVSVEKYADRPDRIKPLYLAAPASPTAAHVGAETVAKAARDLLNCLDGLPIDTDEATTDQLTAFDRTRSRMQKALATPSSPAIGTASDDECDRIIAQCWSPHLTLQEYMRRVVRAACTTEK